MLVSLTSDIPMTLPAAMKLKPGPNEGKGGRPHKEGALHDATMMDSELKGILLIERKGSERYNDTAKRLPKERADKIAALHQQVDQLSQLVNEQAQTINELQAQLLHFQKRGIIL